MRTAAYIFTLTWGLLMIQPLFGNFGGKPAYSDCVKKAVVKAVCSTKKSLKPPCPTKKTQKPTCQKDKCKKPSQPENKKDCRTTGNCNPTLGCSSGNFYVHQHHHFTISFPYIPRQKMIAVNDNRISKSLAECWHPPEMIS